MTPAELQQAIEANTQAIADLNQAVSFLVTEAIRPAVQQAAANYEQLEQLIVIVERNADAISQVQELQAGNSQQTAQNTQAISSLVELVTASQQQIAANAQQIAANTETVTTLTELSRNNAEAISALTELSQNNAEAISALTELSRNNAEAVTTLTEGIADFDSRLEDTRNLVADNAQQQAITNQKVDALTERMDAYVQEGEAFREIQREHLRAIIGNAQRIDRLEQQAS